MRARVGQSGQQSHECLASLFLAEEGAPFQLCRLRIVWGAARSGYARDRAEASYVVRQFRKGAARKGPYFMASPCQVLVRTRLQDFQSLASSRNHLLITAVAGCPQVKSHVCDISCFCGCAL